jgi:signal transduction histidine kinase
MTLRTRLILTIGGVALLLVLPALFAAYHLSRLSQIATDQSDTHGAAYLAMGRFQAHLTDIDRLTRVYVAVAEADVAARRDSAIANARVSLARLSQAGYADMAASARAPLETLESELWRIDQLVVTGRADAATAALENVRPVYAEAERRVREIALEIDRRSEADLLHASRISAAALTTTMLALIACVFIAVLLGTWATHTMVQPILRLRRATAAVAAGEFVVPGDLPYDRGDEIGDLSRSFRGMAEQLALLDQMKADFMSIAAHELKTPINVIGGYAELLQDGVYGGVTNEQDIALTSIQEQARILTQLVNQLLDISRLEAGGMRLEIAEMPVPELFERLQRTYEVLARRQEIELQVELGPDAPATIPADAARLRDQVLGNLLANALKFTPPGGTIRVVGRSENDEFHIEVSDTGAGMPAEQLPHVFDKYFQIGEQARSKGAGLGLTIAHDIVEEHGGTITVDSVEGTGTTFRITLPTSRQAMPATASVAHDEA